MSQESPQPTSRQITKQRCKIRPVAASTCDCDWGRNFSMLHGTQPQLFNLRGSPMRMPSTPVSSSRRVFGVVAFVVMLLIVIEAASFVVLQLLALRDRARPSGDEAAPTYRDVPWADAYWREHRQFLARSY